MSAVIELLLLVLAWWSLFGVVFAFVTPEPPPTSRREALYYLLVCGPLLWVLFGWFSAQILMFRAGQYWANARRNGFRRH